MYVGRVMHTDLVTISPDTPLSKAKDIVDEKKIAHLLIVDRKGDLRGLLSDRDIKRSWASPATTLSVHELNYLLEKVTVDMVMVKKIISVSPDTTIERAAQIMQENRISALPVVRDGTLAGIITTTDVMGVLLEAIGIDRGDSTRFEVLAEWNRIGVVAEITGILKAEEINIRSLFVWPDRDHSDMNHLVMRVGAETGEKAISSLREKGFRVLTEYVADITPCLSSE
ncbi:acetoin utilization protein AcuB [Desulfonema ishimotonii]|uniref:Acetoin utilization protein AcuB n=1 Tax=Desulfonema ishimotonii TaxID=45657 RepID=A0A401G4K7_9BACT|nr:CBS and ACT domain-containing protein [Desulfonema ishimotonii]GBC64131.1 acetoin utilization protein AcuB [Desulfonema ishimotonii]